MSNNGKYSEGKVTEICDYIESGLTAKDAAMLAGITEETYYSWKKTKPEFSESVKKAELELKKKTVKGVLNAGDKDWRANAWWLERKYTDEFYLNKNESATPTVNMVVYLPERLIDNRKVIEGETITEELNGGDNLEAA